MVNPFAAGPIVDPNNFIGRRHEIDILLSALENRLSICIIGEPHIGKSSLLHYIAYGSWRKSEHPRLIFVLRDGMNLGERNTHVEFWQSVLRDAVSNIDNKAFARKINDIINSINRSVENVRFALEKMIENDFTLVLLLDELDAMVATPGLADISFWGQFRYLASSRLFCFVGASRKDLFTVNTALNEALKGKIPQLRDFGSPIFNIAESIYLKPFSDGDTDQLFESASAKTVFSPLDVKIMKRLGGGHPYLLQKLASHMWNQKRASARTDHQQYVETVLESLDDYFQDIWHQLGFKPGSWALAILITLRELARTLRDISILKKDIDLLHQAGQSLERIGMIKKVKNQYELFGSLYAFWIQRNILAQPVEILYKYLTEKERNFFNITVEHQNSIFHTISQMYREINEVTTDVSAAFVKAQLAKTGEEMGIYDEYKTGLEKLFLFVKKDNPRYLDTISLQSRLNENIQNAKQYGDTSELRATRNQILEQLNQIALEITGAISFNDLCAGVEYIAKPSPKITVRRSLKKKIFISHSSKDRDFVVRLSNDLLDAGHQVWYSGWEIKVGQSIPKKINEGLAESSHLAVVLSPNSIASDWVQKELNSTLMEQLNKQKIVILPILYLPCEIPMLLRDILYADMSKNYRAGLDRLLEALAESPTRPKRRAD